MPNWTESMQQTFEFYIVDPGTWEDVRLIDHVISCTIDRDKSVDTLESASFELSDDIGETYIRVYLVTIQNGVKERHPLGTFLVQTVPNSFDGRIRSISADAYSPLIELNEKYPPFGFCVGKGANIMEQVYILTRDNVRAPVLKADCPETMFSHFVVDSDDKWLSCILDLLANAKYEFSLDEKSRILFYPKQKTEALQPVWTFDDGNSSILYPDMDSELDLYGIPNVVEVMYSNGVDYNEGGRVYYARVVNDDPDSITSTVRRGREIVHRVTDPSIIGNPSEDRIKEYAETLLKELSTVERTISYMHGYCPVRVGDCVRINYEGAGFTDIKARVISQSISCVPGTPVSETAVYAKKYWR